MSQRIIDIHVHLFPERMFDAIWSFFEGRDWPVHREPVPVIADTLRAHGVEMAVGLSYPHKRGVARSLNTFMASVGEGDGIFRPFGSVMVGDEDYRVCVDEVLASPHLHGFKFQPLVQRFDINHPDLDYLYGRCVEDDFPVLIHAGRAPTDMEFVGFEHFAKLIARFPELRVCVAHMGAPECDEFLRLVGDHPRMYLDTTMINTRTDLFDNRFGGSGELLLGCADRVCFGSDWPNVPYSYAEAVQSVVRFGLPEGRLAGVYGGNAARFLKLG